MFGYAWCGNTGVGGWAAMIGFWVVFLGFAGWAILRVFPRRDGDRQGPDAVDLLDHRLASGEIDEETYRRARDTLVGGVRR